MKIPKIFIPEKKLDNKLEELLKEVPLQKPQINKNEIPNYAIQENGDYLVMRGGIIMNTSNCRSITSSTFYFTIDGKEHKLYIGNEIVTKLDERFVIVEEGLVSKLFELGLVASQEPDYNDTDNPDWWKLDMKQITKNVYEELVKFVKNA